VFNIERGLTWYTQHICTCPGFMTKKEIAKDVR
jgi:hypothetical protein